jgi:biotin operon repressor
MTASRLRLVRCLRLLTLLQSGVVAKAERLAQELGVSQRTIFRYVNLLEEAGFELWHDSAMEGYVLADGPDQHPCPWTEDELVALILAVRGCPLAGNRDLARTLRPALHKVIAQASESLRADLLRLEKSCGFVGSRQWCLAGKTAILSSRLPEGGVVLAGIDWYRPGQETANPRNSRGIRGFTVLYKCTSTP